MAEGVVYVLEVIYISQNDPNRRDFTHAAVQFAVKKGEYLAPVQEQSQEVVSGGYSEGLASVHQFLMKIEDSLACQQTSFQFQGIKWLY